MPERHQSPAQKIKFGLEYLGLRILGGLIYILPLSTATEISAFLWRLIAPRLHRHHRAHQHLKLAFPNMDATERETILLKMWDNLGRVFVENFKAETLRDSNPVLDVEGEENLKAHQQFIGVSLHMGNWDIVPLMFSQANNKTAAIYKEVKNPYVEAYLRTLRAPVYPGGLFARSTSGAKAAIKHVKQGSVLCMLGDLFEKNGVETSFFNHTTTSTPFPAWLSQKTGLPIILACTTRVNKSTFKVAITCLPAPKDQQPQSVRELTCLIQSQFEDWIRKNPSQWMWAHRRWGRLKD